MYGSNPYVPCPLSVSRDIDFLMIPYIVPNNGNPVSSPDGTIRL
jgi:hypothetical protein